ncbi:MAG TPA: acyl transferase, partial [Alistipes sp.]|nr:acyl transferase [Alistipes sp.]
HSCAFIETQDAGIAYPDGSFSVLGRMDRTQTRGCNLLVD